MISIWSKEIAYAQDVHPFNLGWPPENRTIRGDRYTELQS
ncbi:hypothetical protein OP10G_3141 [Fimbriimonas ginsengisoli Gsoil 348]|uniref:Uncharacterized protein n=1 Tax=Fimbriimonas ginsengisoli Gsoil 348 TaxID=661478 RepID=A0A068NXX9_FIMGI|nr:hypothetical protein OP10G_3141 [Fimbriimonas ginsengisoli Gsoil 348]